MNKHQSQVQHKSPQEPFDSQELPHANLHEVAAKEVAASPSGSPDEETVKAIYEIALRSYDQIEKAYDTMNTRVGVVFGFSSFEC